MLALGHERLGLVVSGLPRHRPISHASSRFLPRKNLTTSGPLGSKAISRAEERRVQLLKANGLRLAPRVQSMGYDKATGKKQVRRYYEVEEG